jgi:glycosyltransferase involved in cell wall biosynthesis
VVGDAAVLVDPYDAGSIADGVLSVLGNEALRLEMIHKGLARARQFSWERSVARTHDIYMDVLG